MEKIIWKKAITNKTSINIITIFKIAFTTCDIYNWDSICCLVFLYKPCVNPWQRGSDFQVTAASWNWSMVMNTARCEGNCLQNFIEPSAAYSLLEVAVSACCPSGTQYFVYSLFPKHAPFPAGTQPRWTWLNRLENSQLRKFGPLWKPQWTNAGDMPQVGTMLGSS